MYTRPQPDLTRIFLVVLIIALLIAGSLWTLLPFLGALIWATTIVIATWPLLLRIQRWAGGRRSVATAFMVVVMLVVFVVPFAVATATVLDALQEGVGLVKGLMAKGLQPPPPWVADLPWVGAKLAERWQELAAGGPNAIGELLRPYLSLAAAWAVSATGGVGVVVLNFLLTVILAAVLYSNGEMAAKGVVMFARRLSGDHGERTARLAGQAVRGVALGVVITALVQSLIAGIGLWLAGLPRPALLVALVFVFAVAQIGPLPVLGPVVVWLYWSGDIVWGTVMLVFALMVAVVDNVLKPVLIRRGVDLPLLLIVAGVIGGLVGFGVLGLFIGPVLLAVTFTLLQSWVRETPELAATLEHECDDEAA